MVTAIDYETNKLVAELLINLGRFKSSESEVKRTIEEYFEHTEFFVNILDDCFGLISQSIQAIRTLQNENLNLKEQLGKDTTQTTEHQVGDNDTNLTLSQFDDRVDTTVIKPVKQEKPVKPEKTIPDKTNSRVSLRQQLRSQKSDKEQPQRSLSTSFDNPESVKITNEIIRKTAVTEKYSIYLGEKYAKGSFKDFLNQLVKMSYPISVLRDIQADIARLENTSTEKNGLTKYKIIVNQMKQEKPGDGFRKSNRTVNKSAGTNGTKTSIKLNRTNFS
jgi:hypothetical protein